MKTIKKIWDAITLPFISVAVMLDESKRINEDGSWDKYWERKNRKKRKEQKDEKTTAGYCRKNLWSFNRD